MEIFLTLLSCAVISGIVVLFAGAMVGISVLFFRGMPKAFKKMAPMPAVVREDYLAVVSLAPWTPLAFSDLSSRWEGWWRQIMGLGKHESYTQGVVKSLSNPAGPGWMSFVLERRQVRSGVMVLKTSERRVELNITAKSYMDANIEVEARLDGNPCGRITVRYPTCTYQSTDGATQATWLAALHRNIHETFVLDRLWTRAVAYDPITVNGRQIAALTNTWIRYPHPNPIEPRPFPPALQSVAPSLTPNEQDALLIVLAMGLYYDDMRNRRYRYDW